MVLALALPIADSADRHKLQARRMPPAPPPLTVRRAPAVDVAEAEGTLVLLVDDHPINRMLLQRQLNTLGYAAETAQDGQEALAMWRSGRFALVVTDCEMPTMSGYELAAEIRRLERDEGLERTPVFACTAHALAGEAEKCMAAGMDECLVKPIDLALLQENLQRWLPLQAAGEEGDHEAGVAAQGADAPLDLSLIASTWGDEPGQVQDILQFFQRTNNEDAASLHDALAARDLAHVTRAAHRMLGASRMVGALAFAAECDRIYCAAREKDWEAVLAALQPFQSEWRRLNAFVDELAPAP